MMDTLNIISLVVGIIIGLAGILSGYKIAKKSGPLGKLSSKFLYGTNL